MFYPSGITITLAQVADAGTIIGNYFFQGAGGAPLIKSKCQAASPPPIRMSRKIRIRTPFPPPWKK